MENENDSKKPPELHPIIGIVSIYDPANVVRPIVSIHDLPGDSVNNLQKDESGEACR